MRNVVMFFLFAAVPGLSGCGLGGAAATAGGSLFATSGGAGDVSKEQTKTPPAPEGVEATLA